MSERATERAGEPIAFVGRSGPRLDDDIMDGIARGDHGYEPHAMVLSHHLGTCHDEDVHYGYDPYLGYGDEASRPPDYYNPEDDVAYPEGVIYDDDYADEDCDDYDRYGDAGRQDDTFYDAYQYHDGG